MKHIKSIELTHKLPAGKSEHDYPYASSASVFKTNQLSLYSEKVAAGKKASAPHFHKHNDEIVYVTKGELWAFEGEERVQLKVGDGILFSANSNRPHYLENQSDNEAEFLLFKATSQSNDVIYE